MKLFISVFALFLFAAVPLSAHPPQNVVVTYDFESQTLKVSARHTTHDPREDYVRKVEITHNGEEVETVYHRIQLNTLTFQEEFSLPAEDGDLFEVTLFSSEGGVASGDVTVVEPDETEEEVSPEVKTKEPAPLEEKPSKSKGSGKY